MRKIILGLAATAAIAAPLLAMAGPASARTARQCETAVTSTVTTTTANFTVRQPKDTVGQFDNVWKHVYTVTVKPDGSFAGTGSITDNDGPVAWTETITGTFTDGPDDDTVDDHVTFNTVPDGGGATFAVTNAPMDSSRVLVESNWAGNIIEFQIAQPVFKIVTENGVTEFANHGEYVSASGGVSVVAKSCVGMPIKANKVK
jgi:hypothetical protein